MQPKPPTVIDESALSTFRQLALKSGLDPDNLWVGGYVKYEWEHVRHVFQSYELNLAEMTVLEVGCNYGASAIVLAQLGARVTAIDVNPENIEIAKANAACYGLLDRIDFLLVPDTTTLPFGSATFSMVNCNSVLEYIPKTIRGSVLKEIDRVLKSQGIVLISGTSNRLWPKEMHSGKWLVNYLPNFLDRLIFKNTAIERGVFPWEIYKSFSNYENIDREGKGQQFLEAKRRMGMPSSKITILRFFNALGRTSGIWIGLLMPSLTVALRKL